MSLMRWVVLRMGALLHTLLRMLRQDDAQAALDDGAQFPEESGIANLSAGMPELGTFHDI